MATGSARTVVSGASAPDVTRCATSSTHHARGLITHNTTCSTPPGSSASTAAMTPKMVIGAVTGVTSRFAMTPTIGTRPVIMAMSGSVSASAATATPTVEAMMGGSPQRSRGCAMSGLTTMSPTVALTESAKAKLVAR